MQKARSVPVPVRVSQDTGHSVGSGRPHSLSVFTSSSTSPVRSRWLTLPVSTALASTAVGGPPTGQEAPAAEQTPPGLQFTPTAGSPVCGKRDTRRRSRELLSRLLVVQPTWLKEQRKRVQSSRRMLSPCGSQFPPSISPRKVKSTAPPLTFPHK